MSSRSGLFAAGLCITIVSIVGFVVSAWVMAGRIGAFYRAAPPAQFEFKQINRRTLPVHDWQVTLTDDRMPDGREALRIVYGESSILLPVHAPKISSVGQPADKVAKLDLAVYDEWLAFLAFEPFKSSAAVQTSQADGVQAGSDMAGTNQPGIGQTGTGQTGTGRATSSQAASDLRFVLVKRNASPGNDDGMGGTVDRKHWTFDVIEFLPSGGISPMRTLQFQAADYRTGELYLPARRKDPGTRVEPIADRSWEFQAVLYAIPKLQIANYRYRTDAVAGTDQVSGMGMTLPGAGFSVMGIVLGVIMTAIGRGKRAESPPPTPRA